MYLMYYMCIFRRQLRITANNLFRSVSQKLPEGIRDELMRDIWKDRFDDHIKTVSFYMYTSITHILYITQHGTYLHTQHTTHGNTAHT